MKVKDVAKAFAAGKPAHCGNALTDGKTYWLHGNAIAVRAGDIVSFDWCGWHTPTTARHMNNILAQWGRPSVSYSHAVNFALRLV